MSHFDIAALAVDDEAAHQVSETLAWVAPHCDIEERMGKVPPSARCRGVWSKLIDRQLKERGLYDEYRRRLPLPSLNTLGFHPVGDLLLRAAVAGALVAGPENLHDGMFEMTRDNARQFTGTLMGRTLVKLLARDPKRLCQQVLASRRQTCNYGSWEVLETGPTHAKIYLREEYMWMESYLLGAAEGTFAALGEKVEATVELEDPFHGVHIIRWQ